MNSDFRIESDSIGEMKIPKASYWGIHTYRAFRNFPFSNIKITPELLNACLDVKIACARTNKNGLSRRAYR